MVVDSLLKQKCFKKVSSLLNVKICFVVLAPGAGDILGNIYAFSCVVLSVLCCFFIVVT